MTNINISKNVEQLDDAGTFFHNGYEISLSRKHNYNDSITYFSVCLGNLVLGKYWRDPWVDGWICQPIGLGDYPQQEAQTNSDAINCILSYYFSWNN